MRRACWINQEFINPMSSYHWSMWVKILRAAMNNATVSALHIRVCVCVCTCVCVCVCVCVYKYILTHFLRTATDNSSVSALTYVYIHAYIQTLKF